MIDLKTIRDRERAATPGPWKIWGMEVRADPEGDSNLETSILVARTYYINAHGRPRTNDAEFVAGARKDIPDLLGAVDKLAVAARALLETLPKCHGCKKPATRVMYGPFVTIPYSYYCESGKTFETRPYIGSGYGAQFYVPPDGRWKWDCCDEHEMPEAETRYDLSIAKAVRDSYSVIGEGG